MFSNGQTPLNFGKITALSTLRTRYVEIGRAFDLLGAPMCDDLSMMDVVYAEYLRMFALRGQSAQAARVYNRKKFLFVVLYIFAPKALVGGKMRIGMRDRLARLFGLAATSAVSDNCSSLLDIYRLYRDFRDDVARLYEASLEAIENTKKVVC